MSTVSDVKRTPTPPRKAAEIHSATLSLLADRGYDELTVEAIADRAGVNKTTIYRSWATKDDVVAAALIAAPELSLAVADTGSLQGDLVAFARRVADLLTETTARRIVTAMVSAMPDRPSTTAAARAFFADRLAREQVMFERARSRGEATDDIDPELIVDLIAGNLWFHLLVRDRHADDDYLERLVDTVLHGPSGIAH